MTEEEIYLMDKAYKMIKLIKLLRIMKIIKDRTKIFYYMDRFIGVSAGIQRLMFYFLIFIILSHIATCLWIIIANIVGNKEKDGTWLKKYYKQYKDDDLSLYYVSFYWCITTITTVGYGDISGTNNYERVFCSLIMVVGVIMFSLANGALASLISSEDNAAGSYVDKIEALNQANKEFQLPQHLFV